jgi:riboflavin biosynthesis pyrimidine reductase
MTVVSADLSFEVLFEDPEKGKPDSRSLISAVRDIYGGDWILPQSGDRPYCYSNFVMSHDGRISFAVTGYEGGGDVSGFDTHDQWLMGLLRSRADAVMVGANTLRSEPEHVWTAEFIAPNHASLFEQQRQSDGRTLPPLQVFVTSSGQIFRDAAVFQRPDVRVVVVTTERAQAALEELELPRTEVLVAGATEIDIPLALAVLSSRWGVQTLLCEGGPRLYGSLVSSGSLDEEFLTLSPLVIGSSADAPRPGLIEGYGFVPGGAPRVHPLSLRRAGDHLFFRTAWSGSWGGVKR